MSEIIGDYKNWQGEQLFQPKSTFTLKGFEFEFKKWDIEKENNPIDKLMFNLWMVEPSPNHPAVMGKIEYLLCMSILSLMMLKVKELFLN